MAERSESDIVAKAPITIKFGDTDYKVKPLTISKAAEWRKQAIEAVKSIADVHGQDCADNNAFTHGLAFFFLQFPEKMMDLVCSYAGEAIPRAAAEAEGTDEQLALAFGEIVKIAFPFTKELGTISQVMGIASSFPRLARSTK